MQGNKNYAEFNYKTQEGLLNIRLDQFNAGTNKIEMFSRWLGKSVAINLLLAILKRINNSFGQDNNGWHYQDPEIVDQIKIEMKTLLGQDWTGTSKEEKIKPEVE